jgi:intein-encoded DNA endonuclease-like protein
MKEKIGELFKKVYVRTKDDLPKEEGYYFISTGERYDRNFDIYHFTKVNAKQNHLDWLHHVVWYLVPTEVAEATEEMYPKEFVKWIFDENNEMIFDTIYFENLDINDVFKYWKQNIRK